MVWTGADLVTAAVSVNNILYAYEQVPGAATWRRQVIEDGAGGISLGMPSVTATATSVQVVSEDANGNIWFYQQADGQSTWSAPQLVGSVNYGAVEGIPAAKIAWTGVPGHAGTNSVITAPDAAGDIQFWYQSGGGWVQETAASPAQGVGYGAPDLTATSTGVVIAAVGSNGAFYSFYEPYGGQTWNSDGTLGAGSGQGYDEPAITWDGTNVDVAIGYFDGTGETMRFAWKSNAAEFWSQQRLPGVTDAQPLVFGTATITWTGDNLLLGALQELSLTKSRLDFWWQGSTFTTFNRENVVVATSPGAFGAPALVSTGAAAGGETVLTAAGTTNDFRSTGLYDWTQPTFATGWTRHKIVGP